MEQFAMLARQRSLPRSLCASCWNRYVFRSKFRPPRESPRSSSFFSTSSLRPATTTAPRGKDENPGIGPQDPPQAYPLSGYYSDLLRAPFPHARRARSTRKVVPTTTTTTSSSSQEEKAPPPTPASTTEPQSPADKMSIVFGSRLAGPGYKSTRYNPATMPPESTWKTVNGVAIPPRPVEPDNCCMSGCAHCVWDDYRDEMEVWAARVQEAQAKAKEARPSPDMRQSPRAEVDSASMSMDDDGGGSETNWSMPSPGEDIDDNLFAGIPVGIREFMKTEKRLRDKHRKEREKNLT
ncbi:hypothetical protein VTN77DRAFT_8497 [Rasamsonia byssochlamydoides]|uniref:uncharacterized protein n=1 Tax=Rasamsonia byssochlamydoides TaxID=89139 RepID=UPI00374304AB